MKIGEELWATVDEDGVIQHDGCCPIILDDGKAVAKWLDLCKQKNGGFQYARVVKIRLVQEPSR